MTKTPDSGAVREGRITRAARVRAARAYADLDQADIGEALGKSVYTVKRLERGVRDISDDELRVIARVCGVPVSFLLAGFADVKPRRGDPLTVGAAEKFFGDAVAQLTTRIAELEALVEERTGEDLARQVRDALNA